MAEQKLIATGEARLGLGDMFEMAKKAEKAKHVLEQAQTEIRKHYPDFKFTFTTGNWYDPEKPRPGRRSNAETAAATGEATVAGTANGAATGEAATA